MTAQALLKVDYLDLHEDMIFAKPFTTQRHSRTVPSTTFSPSQVDWLYTRLSYMVTPLLPNDTVTGRMRFYAYRRCHMPKLEFWTLLLLPLANIFCLLLIYNPRVSSMRHRISTISHSALRHSVCKLSIVEIRFTHRRMFTQFQAQGMTSPRPSNDIEDFHALLSRSKRVLSLLGAGLSASSGLPTFRGAGGLWRSHDSMSLATPQAFAADPALVWRFYSCECDTNYIRRTSPDDSADRRHMALTVRPNPAHYALAALARKLPGFVTLSQNVDGLSPRAEHPKDQLKLLHGSLFEVKCNDSRCGYVEENYTDPIVPALDLPDGKDITSDEYRTMGGKVDISDPQVQLAQISREDLPTCPQCRRALLRPGVVWFGEALPDDVVDSVYAYLDEPEKVDLIMVIGTGAKVYPAAGYIEEAREKGAKVCVVNMGEFEGKAVLKWGYDANEWVDANDAPPGGWAEGDFFFQGDAATIVPELLRPIIGEVKVPEQEKAKV